MGIKFFRKNPKHVKHIKHIKHAKHGHQIFRKKLKHVKHIKHTKHMPFCLSISQTRKHVKYVKHVFSITSHLTCLWCTGGQNTFNSVLQTTMKPSICYHLASGGPPQPAFLSEAAISKTRVQRVMGRVNTGRWF